MAAVNEERLGCQPVTNRSAGATTLEWGAHDLLLLLFDAMCGVDDVHPDAVASSPASPKTRGVS
jgi:hypothetical protein